jgi:HSP20 family protein
LGGTAPELEASDVREPLVDVIAEDDRVKVLAELPGVEKSDIQLQCHDNMLEISVDTSGRKYRKTVELPAEVDPDVSQAKYNNGVLEVTLKTRKPSKPQGKTIRIE